MDPQTVIQGLIARGMPAHIAQGFAGNFAVESGFDPSINEIAPLVPGSRGGFGLAQWTGPRRRALEAYAEQTGLPASDPNVQMDFLMSELAGPENRAWQSIQSAQDPAEAARLVSERFLRPGIPHLERRVNSALQFAGMEPQMLQSTASSQSQERPGFLNRVQDFFTTGDPNAGQATDPFAGLSRAQRTVLGFAALRDAAAALEGRDSAFFNQAMGGFEAGRERERLRAQGQMQNQVGALQALAQIEQQIAFSQSLGMAPSPAVLQLRDMLTAQAMGGGAPAPAVVRDGGTGPMPSPGDFTGGVVPADMPVGPQGVTGPPPTGVAYEPGSATPVPYDGEPETAMPSPAPMDDLAAQEQALLDQMRARIAVGAPVDDLQIQMQTLQQQREDMAERTEEQERRQEAAETRAPQTVNTLQTVQDLRSAIEADPRVTTGFWGNLLGNVPGTAAYDARALAQTIRANLGFDQLQAMREASPTGGALGQVAVQELEALQSTIANLDLAQSPDQVMSNLEAIENNYQRLIRRAYETSDDPAALDAALGGRPAFMVEGGGAASGGAGISPEDQDLLNRYLR